MTIKDLIDPIQRAIGGNSIWVFLHLLKQGITWIKFEKNKKLVTCEFVRKYKELSTQPTNQPSRFAKCLSERLSEYPTYDDRRRFFRWTYSLYNIATDFSYNF